MGGDSTNQEQRECEDKAKATFQALKSETVMPDEAYSQMYFGKLPLDRFGEMTKPGNEHFNKIIIAHVQAALTANGDNISSGLTSQELNQVISDISKNWISLKSLVNNVYCGNENVQRNAANLLHQDWIKQHIEYTAEGRFKIKETEENREVLDMLRAGVCYAGAKEQFADSNRNQENNVTVNPDRFMSGHNFLTDLIEIRETEENREVLDMLKAGAGYAGTKKQFAYSNRNQENNVTVNPDRFMSGHNFLTDLIKITCDADCKDKVEWSRVQAIYLGMIKLFQNRFPQSHNYDADDLIKMKLFDSYREILSLDHYKKLNDDLIKYITGKGNIKDALSEPIYKNIDMEIINDKEEFSVSIVTPSKNYPIGDIGKTLTVNNRPVNLIREQVDINERKVNRIPKYVAHRIEDTGRENEKSNESVKPITVTNRLESDDDDFSSAGELEGNMDDMYSDDKLLTRSSETRLVSQENPLEPHISCQGPIKQLSTLQKHKPVARQNNYSDENEDSEDNIITEEMSEQVNKFICEELSVVIEKEADQSNTDSPLNVCHGHQIMISQYNTNELATSTSGSSKTSRFSEKHKYFYANTKSEPPVMNNGPIPFVHPSPSQALHKPHPDDRDHKDWEDQIVLEMQTKQAEERLTRNEGLKEDKVRLYSELKLRGIDERKQSKRKQMEADELCAKNLQDDFDKVFVRRGQMDPVQEFDTSSYRRQSPLSPSAFPSASSRTPQGGDNKRDISDGSRTPPFELYDVSRLGISNSYQNGYTDHRSSPSLNPQADAFIRFIKYYMIMFVSPDTEIMWSEIVERCKKMHSTFHYRHPADIFGASFVDQLRRWLPSSIQVFSLEGGNEVIFAIGSIDSMGSIRDSRYMRKLFVDFIYSLLLAFEKHQSIRWLTIVENDIRFHSPDHVFNTTQGGYWMDKFNSLAGQMKIPLLAEKPRSEIYLSIL